MPRTTLVLVLAGLSFLPTSAGHAAPPPSPAFVPGQLQALHYWQAAASADPARLAALVATDFHAIDSAGRDLDRTGFLAGALTRPQPERLEADESTVRVFGSVALVHALSQAGGDGGGAARLRHTYAYHWNGERWQLVSVQDTSLRDGVSWQVRQAVAPDHAPWQGSDPQGDDETVLRQLNENYVRAFREADVAWFDAHLAPDYRVVNSDGSVDDRAAALAEFARPVFADHIESFPVDKVRVRRFGDVALIHAENDFRLKDGRRGINRYTDIWHRQPDGRWLCVSAHITTFRPPA